MANSLINRAAELFYMSIDAELQTIEGYNRHPQHQLRKLTDLKKTLQSFTVRLSEKITEIENSQKEIKKAS